MEDWHLMIFSIISTVVIQIGMTIRRNIIERNKSERIDRVKGLNTSKIDAIGRYENKPTTRKYFNQTGKN